MKIKNIHIIINPAAGRGETILPVINTSLKEADAVKNTRFKCVQPDNLKLVEHWQGKSISVSSSSRQTIQCDGELLKTGPLKIKIIPGAIKVLVPED